VGAIAAKTRLELEPRDAYRRTTRFDAAALLQILESLLASPGLRERVAYRPNPSLYRCGDRRRYVDSRPSADEHRHRLVSVRDSRALTDALEIAADGARPAEIGAALAAHGHPDDRARRYVGELIERRVLVPELDLQLTGADAVYGLAEALPSVKAFADVRAELSSIDAEGLGVAPVRYRRAASLLDELPGEPNVERFFQVDMVKPSPAATLGEEVVDEILRGVDLLRRVGRPDEDTALARFADRLRERYEGEPVPLLEALDPDLGVAFDDDEPAPSSLLAEIGARSRRSSPTWSEREEHLLARVLELQSAGGEELVLDGRDVETLAGESAMPLPDAFAAVAVVASPSRADLARGRFRVLLHGIDGPSGARLLARFAHADPALHAAVEQHLRAEEALDADAVFAEIVHLPRSRDVNVVARPVLRGYEIACLGKSGAPQERQLELSDLLLSVEDGVVVLRSRRLGRRVVPRLTSAHDFWLRGVSVYRFLCRLQAQGVPRRLGFWGPLASAPSLPRVRSGRIVLAAARWRLRADVLRDTPEGAATYRVVAEWRRAQRVPRFVAETDLGGQLPVDLDNALAVDALVRSVRSRGLVELEELFPPADELCVHGPEGAFVHELVVPFVGGAPTAERRLPVVSAGSVRRTFTPGSEWLYARLYTGETLADTVLTKAIAPLVRELTGSDIADRWFFVRYRDPEFHLRVRFHGDAPRLQAEALPAVQEAAQRLVDGGLVWRVEFATYQREVERYGGRDAIDLAERVFHADSDAVLAILPLLASGEEGQHERWRLAIAGCDRLLADLGLDVASRSALVRQRRDSLVRTLGWRGPALGRLGKRFRRERPELERLLDDESDPGPLAPGLTILRKRSRTLAPVRAELERLELERRLTAGRASIAGSMLHMHLNRLLRGDAVAQEAVLCDFLARLYEITTRRPPSRARR
jgi:thiopeptide-type bacteriocin biosynthesis protein